ncbi:MAG: TSUP family transporter, partial [Chloroflexota bacterium]
GIVGMIGGLLGLGGGIMHVPALTQLLGFPIHIATATSHFVVAITTLAAVITHIISGTFAEGASRALVLSAGAVIGNRARVKEWSLVPGFLYLHNLEYVKP